MIDKESYPGTSESPRYLEDKRTCVLQVKLQPGKTYAVWISTEKLQNFKETKGQVAVPYLLVFNRPNFPSGKRRADQSLMLSSVLISFQAFLREPS